MPVEGAGGGGSVVVAVVAMLLVSAVAVEVLGILGRYTVMKSVVVVHPALCA
jgi:hypothetical protein